MSFSGFDRPSDLTPMPEQFITELLAEIDDLGEFKLLLYIFWRLDRQERPYPFVRRSEVAADEGFTRGLGPDAGSVLDGAFARAVDHGALLVAEAAPEPLYLLNTPKGQAALRGLAGGKWDPDALSSEPVTLGRARPNIFELYEKNIGPLTPMLAESLRDAEVEYPYEWIEDAVRIALENNVRKWRYVEAILKSWQEKGRDDGKDQQGTEKDRRKYVEGEFSDFIER